MRELIFGPMPKGATPATHLPAGPWCFCGRESLFPGWDLSASAMGRGTTASHAFGTNQATVGSHQDGCMEAPTGQGFVFPADPFADGQEVEAYSRSANGESIRLIDILGQRLNREHRANRSSIFWETALAPWLTLCVHMLAERQKRVLDLAAAYGNEPLRVALLPPDLPISFQNSLDFMLRGVLDPHFNHFIFSRIVEAVAPPAWDLYYIDISPLRPEAKGLATPPAETLSDAVNQKSDAPAGGKGCDSISLEDREAIRACFGGMDKGRHSTPRQSLRQKLRDKARNWLRDLPFPRYKGFSLPEALLLSLAVVGSGKSGDDRTLPLEAYASAPLQWVFPAEDLILACLPKDFLETPLPSAPGAQGKLRGMTAAFSQDDLYRLQLAAWREGGGKLFCVQHGSNYGNLRGIGGIFFEYRQHAFFTWGWKEHQGWPCNSLPLPHPLTARLRDAHAEQKDSLILVGTEMLPLLYRLKTRPQAGDLPEYRRGKLRFFSALPPHVLEKSMYRPYPASASSLEDGPYVQRGVPGLHLCVGDLTAQMLGCRLLVLDHYGTTLHMALAANVPTICFWNKNQWSMEAGTEQLLDLLAEAGIVHSTPEDAAGQAARVWPDVRAWWASQAVQNARTAWMNSYARCLPFRVTGWSAEMMRLWRTALRSL